MAACAWQRGREGGQPSLGILGQHTELLLACLWLAGAPRGHTTPSPAAVDTTHHVQLDFLKTRWRKLTGAAGFIVCARLVC